MSIEIASEPTPLLRPLPQATEVPLIDLGPLIEPIRAITTLTQAPVALALQGVLTAISIAAQAQANAQTLHDRTPLSLSMFSVAESSARKSSVDRLAMKAIREYEKPLLAKYAKQLALYEESQSSNGRYRVDEDVIERKAHARFDVPTSQPISPQVLFDDMTYEGLVRHLQVGQRSIGLSSDEGGKLVGGYAMSAQNQLGFASALSSLWDGKDINKVRAGTGPVHLSGCRLSLHLSIQPMVAQRLFANEELRDQGFLSRVLIAMPESLKGTRFHREDEESLEKRRLAEEDMESFGEKIVALLKRQPDVAEEDSQELKPRFLELDAAARTHLVDFNNVVELQQSEGGIYENISGFAGKAAEQAARIAGNIALLEYVDAQVIKLQHMAVGIRLMEFYLSEAVRIFDTGQVSQKFLDAEHLRKWLRDRYEEDFVDVSEICKCGPNRLRSSDKIKELLRILEEYGHLKKSEEALVQIKGRKSRRAFRIVRS